MLFLQLTWINLKILVQCPARFRSITFKTTPGLSIFLQFCYLGLQKNLSSESKLYAYNFPLSSVISLYIYSNEFYSFRFSAWEYNSNSTAVVVQVDWNLQKQFGDYLQFWPWKCRSRSLSTTLAIVSFDGKYQNLWMSYICCASSRSIRGINIWNIYLEIVDQK